VNLPNFSPKRSAEEKALIEEIAREKKSDIRIARLLAEIEIDEAKEKLWRENEGKYAPDPKIDFGSLTDKIHEWEMASHLRGGAIALYRLCDGGEFPWEKFDFDFTGYKAGDGVPFIEYHTKGWWRDKLSGREEAELETAVQMLHYTPYKIRRWLFTKRWWLMANRHPEKWSIKLLAYAIYHKSHTNGLVFFNRTCPGMCCRRPKFIEETRNFSWEYLPRYDWDTAPVAPEEINAGVEIRSD